MPAAKNKFRLDLWLFKARFFNSRSHAVQAIAEGYLRLNGTHCTKAGHVLAVGDVLTFPQGRQIRVVRVLALGVRRGPATEAQTLYADLAPTGLE